MGALSFPFTSCNPLQGSREGGPTTPQRTNGPRSAATHPDEVMKEGFHAVCHPASSITSASNTINYRERGRAEPKPLSSWRDGKRMEPAGRAQRSVADTNNASSVRAQRLQPTHTPRFPLNAPHPTPAVLRCLRTERAFGPQSAANPARDGHGSAAARARGAESCGGRRARLGAERSGGEHRAKQRRRKAGLSARNGTERQRSAGPRGREGRLRNARGGAAP